MNPKSTAYDDELKIIPPGKFALSEEMVIQIQSLKQINDFGVFQTTPKSTWTIAVTRLLVGPFHWIIKIRVPKGFYKLFEDYHFVVQDVQFKSNSNAVPSLLGKAIVKHLISNI